MRAGQPLAVASDGITIHTSTSTPSTPTSAPAARSHRGSGLARREHAVHDRARRRDRSPGRSSRRGRGTRARRVTRSSAFVPPNAVTTRGTKCTPIDEADRDARPREARARRTRGASRRMPAPIAAAMIATSSRFIRLRRSACGSVSSEQPRDGEEAGVRHHAVVGPDRLALDVPPALQHLERLDHPERRRRQLLAQPADLQDRRAGTRSRIPPGRSASTACFTTRHGSGRSRTIAVEVALVDALVDVAHLHVERHVGAEERRGRCAARASAKSSRIS